MQQIKNYLSKRYDMTSVLLIGDTEEFVELKKWLQQKKEIIHIYAQTDVENDKEITKVDAIIFDWKCGKKTLQYQRLRPKYVIGRMKKKEDYFMIWTSFRIIAKAIYIEQDRALAPNKVTADIAPCEILDWHKGESDIELSVILPVYNVAKYLPECIESLLRWQVSYVEYIFVNDGSTDESRDIIQQYAQHDRRVRLIDKENGGCASARNRGIEEAKGRYIGFVDSDDFIDDTMFFKLFRRAIMGNYELTYSGYKEYYEADGISAEVLNDCLREPYLTGTYREDKVQLLAINTRVAIWRGIYKKELLERRHIRFHETLKRFDDLPFRVECIFEAKSAACVPEHLYYYRLGRKGQDVSCTDDRLYVHFEIFKYLDWYVEAYKNQKLVDLLQVIKLHTHGYALERIERKYKKEYIKRARQQLDKNMGYWRTVGLILMYTGKGNLGWYTRMKLRR